MMFQAITEIPKELCRIRTLESLYLGRNRLSEIPKEIGMLKRLRELRVEENTVKIVPEELGDCKSLQSLCLHVNSLRDLPIELGHLSDTLEELTIEGNVHLKALPNEFGNLTTLAESVSGSLAALTMSCLIQQRCTWSLMEGK